MPLDSAGEPTMTCCMRFGVNVAAYGGVCFRLWAQAVLKGTSPGVPDTYQGADPWEGTILPSPEGWGGRRWHNVWTGAAMQAAGRDLNAAWIIADLPVTAPTAE